MQSDGTNTETSTETSTSPDLTQTRRMSRRQMLRAAGAISAGLVGTSLAAACSSKSETNTAKTTTGGGAAGGSSAAKSGTPSFTVPQGASLSILLWNHFVPAYDTYFDKLADDWGKANNVKVSVDHIDNSGIPTRIAAEVAARKGHDLFGFNGQIKTRVYEKQLVDLSEIANGLINLYGDCIAMGKKLCVVNGAWLALPDFWILVPPLIRTDLLKQLGLNKPTTWDEMRQVGAKMKAAGHPCGLAISNCNDSNHNLRTIMWAFGASEVADDGKTVTVDTKEMRDWLTWMKGFQEEANSPEVYAWVDVSDNQYLGSGTGGMIHDAISALRSIEGPNKQLFDNIEILPELRGPKRQIMMPDNEAWGIWNFTPKGNIEAAKAFLWHYSTHQKENMTASTGYNMPFFAKQFEKPMPVIGTDPKFQLLQDYTGDLIQTYGYPGVPNGAAEQVLAQYTIPNMVAKATQGSVDDAIKYGLSQMKPIYAQYS